MACTTKKVPDGQYMLTENKFEFSDKPLLKDRIPNYVTQRPKTKIISTRLWLYNLANPKYDTILSEYMTYPSNMRNKKLRDSLFIKYNHPEYVGKGLFFNRIFHTLGKPPLILDPTKTSNSAISIRKFMVYKGYWDAEVSSKNNLDSLSKKAKSIYNITFNDPTYIKSFTYNIPDPEVREIYERQSNEALVKEGNLLDQEDIEKEILRLNELMKSKGYYNFNQSNAEIYFTADTLNGKKQVPLVMDLKKENDSAYKVTTLGNIEVVLLEKLADTIKIKDLDSINLRGTIIRKPDEQFKNRAFWLPVILRKGMVYNQKNFDLTRRNLISTNNFNILRTRLTLGKGENDSILNVQYLLAPLPKHELKLATDFHYSQILNFGFSPSVDYTTRNIFRRAENLTTSLATIFGTTKSGENPDKIFNAYEVSAQVKLTFPKLLLPFRYYKFIPKRYSPRTSINLGASVQNNIGLGRINFNGGLNYTLNVNEVVLHKVSLFDTQFSLTQNKGNYYNVFPVDREIRDDMFNRFFVYDPATGTQYNNGFLSSYDISLKILNDQTFQAGLTTYETERLFIFQQSLLNKARQTQDVVISSVTYNFIYNETAKKEYKNPIYFSVKMEFAGNILNIFNNLKKREDQLQESSTKYVFGIPFSQFAKFDIDFRKYFSFGGKKNLVFRQFIGAGLPYGNSKTMPYIRSYYNGGSNDIRAWKAFEGLGPGGNQLDSKVRSYIMGNLKLTTNLEYRFALNDMFEGAVFTDAGNIWNLRDNGIGDKFISKKFLSQMGIGSGFGIRVNVAYVVLRLDFAYKIHDPNQPEGEQWRFGKFKPLQPTFNLAFGYPF